MVKFVYGNRIGKQTKLRPSVVALIFDEAREKILLTRRTDNGRWCLPGGGIDPGESVAEACIREVIEETGLEVSVTRLVGVYSSPDVILEYKDGNRWQAVVMSFETEITGGELGLSDETTECGYFSVKYLGDLDLMESSPERIQDALKNLPNAIIK